MIPCLRSQRTDGGENLIALALSIGKGAREPVFPSLAFELRNKSEGSIESFAALIERRIRL